MKGKELVSLDLGLLIAGTKYRGEFEERLKSIIKEIERSEGKIILLSTKFTLLLGQVPLRVQSMHQNMLKPPLARGELRAIGATTQGISKYIEKIQRSPDGSNQCLLMNHQMKMQLLYCEV